MPCTVVQAKGSVKPAIEFNDSEKVTLMLWELPIAMKMHFRIGPNGDRQGIQAMKRLPRIVPRLQTQVNEQGWAFSSLRHLSPRERSFARFMETPLYFLESSELSSFVTDSVQRSSKGVHGMDVPICQKVSPRS